jgi:hypothetical protein
MVVAVADRAGNILAVFETPGAPNDVDRKFWQTVPADELAVSLARTAAFFSNDQAPLSSRTVRFISGIHFPPGVAGTPNADLYGIENTNRGCTLSTNYLPGTRVESLAVDRWHPTRPRHHHRQSGYERQRPDRGQSRRRAFVQWRSRRRGGSGEHIHGDCGIRCVFGRDEFGTSCPALLSFRRRESSSSAASHCLSWTKPRSRRARLPASAFAGSYSVPAQAGTLPPEDTWWVRTPARRCRRVMSTKSS